MQWPNWRGWSWRTLITPEWRITSVNLMSMAFPSRLALWMGLLITVDGYFIERTGIMMIGVFLMVVGCVLWLVYRPKPTAARKKKPSAQPLSVADRLKSVERRPKPPKTTQP